MSASSPASQSLTPRDLIEAPRPGCALASPDGSRFLMPVAEHSTETGRVKQSVIVGSIVDGRACDAIPLLTDIRNSTAVWVDDTTILYMHADEEKTSPPSVEIWAKPITGSDEPYRVGALPVDEVNDLKAQVLSESHVRLAFSTPTYASSPTLGGYAKAKEEWVAAKQGSTSRVFDSLMVRNWDKWDEGTLRKVFVLNLRKTDGRWSFHLDDAIAPLSFNARVELPRFRALEHAFNMSRSHFVACAHDPDHCPALHTASRIHLGLLASPGEVKIITAPDVGRTDALAFSPSGDRIAWTENKCDGRWSDRPRIVVYDIATSQRRCLTGSFDRSVYAVQWSRDGRRLYFAAGDHARGKLFVMSADGSAEPVALTDRGWLGSVEILPSKDAAVDRLLLTISTMTVPNAAFLLEVPTLGAATVVEPLRLFDPTPSLSRFSTDVQEIWYKGGKTDVHAWVLRPPEFVAGHKYPVCLHVHGGPQYAWRDLFGPRHYLPIYAARGYIVLAVNPTGSADFGDDFRDGVDENWGGTPLEDINAGVRHLLKTCPEADADRLVAVGASYGGYIMNWLQGHNDLGFKAFVNHAGICDIAEFWYSTDALFSVEADFGGAPYEVPEKYDEWNPRRFIDKCRQDFRVAESTSIGVFNVLQRQGIPSRLIIFEDEAHWIVKPQNSLLWYTQVLDWLDRWAKPDPSPSL